MALIYGLGSGFAAHGLTVPGIKTIAIIGAGVAGLGPAWQLALRGWEVHLFEAHKVGSGASTKAAGMLAPTAEVTFEEEDLLHLGQQSLELYPRWAGELEETTGIDLDYRREGTLMVAIDRDDAEALQHIYNYHQRLGLPVERLLGEEARRREPGLDPSVHFALFSPHDHQIDPVKMITALRLAFLDAGGQLYEESPVAEVVIRDAEVRGLTLVGGEAIEFPNILVAAGAWSRKIAGIPDGILPHIRPVRGQMISVALGEPPLTGHVIRAPDAYLVPKSDGRLLIGATMEERGFDLRHTAGGVLDLLTGAWEALPGIYDAPILDMWTGLRPITLTNTPVIGTTEIDGLHLCVGHGRNGILLAPITAYGLAQWLDEGSAFTSLQPFEP